jgi:hypothetical protein
MTMQLTAHAPLVEESTSSLVENPRHRFLLQRAIEHPSDWLRVS